MVPLLHSVHPLTHAIKTKTSHCYVMEKVLGWILVLLEVERCINMPNVRSHLPGTQTVVGYLWSLNDDENWQEVWSSVPGCFWWWESSQPVFMLGGNLVEVALDASSQGSEDALDLIVWLSSDTWASAVSLCSESEKSRQMNVVYCLWNFLPLIYCFLMSAYRTH